MNIEKYNKYSKHIKFINEYKDASNASSGSKFDPNANVECKNIATLSGELHKEDAIGTNRLLMISKLTEMYGVEVAEEYIRQLESHEIYKHDETSIMPYCVSITMYPFICKGLEPIGGISDAPTNLGSFIGAFINLVFAISSQFAGAVSTPEFITYTDYFIRKEYGEDYYKKSTDIVKLGERKETIDHMITDVFQQVVYSINQPAAARNYQSVFWNVAYFDKPYFNGIFENFIFPDGTEPTWDSVSWLQKRFMVWFNEERRKKVLTFPVETMNLLSNGETCVDTEYKEFTAEMYSKGHSFFTYTSDSVDSLASCCFDGKQKVLVKSPSGVHYMTFKDLYNSNYQETKSNLTVFHNGSWVKGKIIELPKQDTYKITTANKKEIFVTDNHINPTLNGDKKTNELSIEDYLLFNNMPLDTFPEKDKGLTYEQGFLVGMYLGDGSGEHRKETHTPAIHLSINEEKYTKSLEILKKSISQISSDENAEIVLGKSYNNVYPVRISSVAIYGFIKEYIEGNYSYEKELNLNCLLQSKTFRRGILDGYYLTDGGNSNRIYTTSEKLVYQVECLITSLGLNSVVDMTDRTDETIIIRGEEFSRNYPTYCIRWYDAKNKRSCGDIYKIKNNSIYFKITSIEKYETTDESVYCFDMSSKDEPYFTLPNGIITHNCRLKNKFTDNTFSFTLGAGGVSTGSKGVVTINLNRLVQNAAKNNIKISLAVEEQIDKIHKYLLAFNEIITDNFNSRLLPIYDAGYIVLEKQYLTIGINGFVEGAEFLGIEISPNQEYFDYGTKILQPIYDSNRKKKTNMVMFNTEFVPAENLGVKNAKWDKKAGYFVPRDCYNSYFYKVEDDNLNILDKFMLHGKQLTQYLDGGSALHCNLEEHLTQEQYLKLLDTAVITGCSYFTFNVPNTLCKDCGYIDKNTRSKCIKCGGKNLDYLTRIIGYLKRISNFSEPRQKEAKKRYYGKK